MLPKQNIEYNDLDARIWEEEIAPFLPQKIFDCHVHLLRSSDTTESLPWIKQLDTFTYGDVQDIYSLLLPGREVDCVIMGFPFPDIDFDSVNDYALQQSRGNSNAPCYYLVNPQMEADVIRKALERGFSGLKPYRFFSKTGDRDNCRITDMITEEQISAANDLAGIIILHVAKPDAMADEENLADLERLSAKFPDVRFLLAHCARCFIPELMDKCVDKLAQLPNVLIGTSSVSESDVFDMLLTRFPCERILYGSDGVFPGIIKGAFVHFGRSWDFLTPENHNFDLSHCDGRFTFMMYENLRAFGLACKRNKLNKEQLENIFFENGRKLFRQ